MALIELLQHSLWLLLTATLFLGLLVGSFLNVVAWRVPRMLEREWHGQCRELLGITPEHTATADEAPYNLVTPRSRCPLCDHAITALENIPLLSYLVLRGRCSACGAKISPRYPIIEAATGLLSLLVVWQLGPTPQALAGLLLLWSLIALTVIDLDHQLLPDNLTLPLLWLGLLLSLGGLFTSPTDAIIGAIAGYLVLWSVYHAFRLLTGKEGMGYGDFKLLAALGAWFGWQALPAIILFASLVGAVVGITLVLLRGHDRNIPIPFGPYLAAAGLLALLWRDDLIALWGL